MSIRLTPYERFLESLEPEVFPLIQSEAEQRKIELQRRDQFLLLASVGETLRVIAAEDAPEAAIDEFGELLFLGFQYWLFGRRTYAFDERVTARLLEPAIALGGWTLASPPAAYLQFPRNRIWARVSAESAFEPVDGCFVFLAETAPAPDAGAHLRVQLLLGVRSDRPGLSLVSYRTDLAPGNAAREAARPWRPDDQPFANAIPGGDRMGYHTIATTSELEALVLRALWYLDTHPLALRQEDGSSADDESHLPHVLVTTDEG